MMKKLLTLIICLIIIITCFSFSVSANATFKEIRKDVTDLGYGVSLEHIIGTSYSTFNSTSMLSDRTQSIYTASIAKDSKAYVVQWSYFNLGAENSFGISKLETIAADYERKHPNQKVIVATNNWLSDTQSNNVGELDAVQISDGLNYRVSDAQGDSTVATFAHDYIERPNFLGFDATGKIAYFSDDWNNGENYTEDLKLSYYNGINEPRTMLNLSINHINEEPDDGEIAIYFNNYDGEKTTFDNATIYHFKGTTLRHDRISSTSEIERDVFAKGTFIDKVESLNFNYDEAGYYSYYIVSKNNDFVQLDLKNKTLICQHELLGEYASCVGATTYYYHIVRDGVKYNNNYNDDAEGVVEWAKGHQINNEIHPRTAFVIKEDGTFALSVIDGRGVSINDYDGKASGMDYMDMANFYVQEYNAKDVFNYDGGGSSCMIVADGDSFKVVNSPSDGHERGVANATMIVVDREPYTALVSEVTDTCVSLKVTNIESGIKVYASCNNIKKEITSEVTTFDNLVKNTDYQIKLTYVKDSKEIEGNNLQVTTTSEAPKIINFESVSENQSSAILYLEITDPDNIFIDGDISVQGAAETGYAIKDKDTELEFSFTGLKSSTTYEAVINLYYKNTDNKQYKRVFKESFTTPSAKYPDDIEIDLEKYICAPGETTKVIITTTPEGVNGSYTYTSSDETVATVSKTGRITAVGVGKCQITVTTKEGLQQSVFFNVEENKKSGCKSGCIITLISTFSLLSIIYFVKKKH